MLLRFFNRVLLDNENVGRVEDRCDSNSLIGRDYYKDFS